jgi:hypothetical protein
LDVWTSATQSLSLHVIHLLPTDVVTVPLSVERMCKCLRRTIDRGVLHWRPSTCRRLQEFVCRQQRFTRVPGILKLLVLVDDAMDPSNPLQSFASLKCMPRASASRALRLSFALPTAMSFVVMGVDWLLLEVCCTRVALFSDALNSIGTATL